MKIEQINASLIDKAYSYLSYREMIDQLMLENKTTGPNQEQQLIDYAKLNISRMKKWEKKTMIHAAIENDIKNIKTPTVILTITEGWCGDAAQIVPVVEKLCSLNSCLQHKLILRDEHPEIMDHFLTNGGKAIPVFVFIDTENYAVTGHWGPRPNEAQQIMNTLKTNPDLKKDDLIEKLHAWYAKDNANSIQKEFTEVLLQSLKFSTI